jgi:hypothetical protein
MKKSISVWLVLLIALSGGLLAQPVQPVTAQFQEVADQQALDEARHLLRRAKRQLNRIEEPWRKRSEVGMPSGRLQRSIEEQRARLERLEQELGRLERERALPQRSETGIKAGEVWRLRNRITGVAEDLERLGRRNGRAFERQAFLHSEIESLRDRVSFLRYRLGHGTDSARVAATGQLRRRIETLRTELDQLGELNGELAQGRALRRVRELHAEIETGFGSRWLFGEDFDVPGQDRAATLTKGSRPPQSLFPAVAPINDDCSFAQAIGNGTFSGSTLGATNDGSASCGASSESPDVWYRYAATANGSVVFDTVGSTYDTVLSLHSGCPGTEANQLACNDDWGSPQSWVTLDMTTGEEVLVRVSGYFGSVGDFTLNASVSGSVSGTVTDASSGNPLENVEVTIWDASGNWVGDDWTDVSGNYSVGSLSPGSAFATTWNDLGYIDELYDDIECVGGCDVTAGTPITVIEGADTPNKNFALEEAGSIAGAVRDASDSSAITSGGVSIYDSDGDWVKDSWLDGSGNYLAGGLPDGTYYATTYNWEGYLDELWDDIPCWDGCTVTSGDSIVVAAGADVTGIDFELVQGGSISGQVMASGTGTPITSGGVSIYDSDGDWVKDGWLDGSGNYVAGGLPDGAYYATTYNWEGYLDELWDDIPCWDGCTVTSGDSIVVAAGADVTGIDFDLVQGGSISGQVTASGPGTPITDGRVAVYDDRGWWIDSDWLDGSGSYLVEGLGPGTYYARVYNYEGYLDELYDDILCVGGCEVTNGTGITVAPPAATQNIDFVLDLGGSVEGAVLAAADSTPVVGLVNIYDTRGDWLSYGYTDSTGSYQAGGLPSGDYHAITRNWDGYIDEIYDDVVCLGGYGYGCLNGGTPIPVTVGSPTTADFFLAKGGTFSGTVTESGSSAPINDVEIEIYDAVGSWVAYAYPDASGVYTSTALVTGTYYAQTDIWNSPHLNELYSDLPCPGGWCLVEWGTPIAVTAPNNTPGRDFALDRGGTVSGRVTDANTGLPLYDVQVRVESASGEYYGYAYTNSSGDYISRYGLPTGTYFVRTSNWDGYLNELYDDLPCPGWCEDQAGTPVSVTQGVDTPNIDFGLVKGGGPGGGTGFISGRITEEGAGDPVPDVDVDIYDASGSWVASSYADSSGHYEAGGLSTGSYFGRTWNWEGYLDELYDDFPCWDGCDVTTGTEIAVTDGGETPDIDFALQPGGTITGTVTDLSLNPIDGVNVEVYDGTGNYVTYGNTDSTGYYRADGLPTGAYYARTSSYYWSPHGYLDELYDDIPCPFGDCDVTAGASIAVTQGETTGGTDFQLELGGSISGRITAAGSGMTIPWTGIEIYDSGGDWLAYGYSDYTGYYRVRGLPTGSYRATTSNGSDFIDELYDNLPCPQGDCDVTAGTAIAVTQGHETSGRDFALDRGGRILGTVTEAATGLPVGNSRVRIYDSAGQQVGWSWWGDSAGRFVAGGLLAGDYHALAESGWGHLAEAFEEIPCAAGCDITAATVIPVALGGIATDVDFTLDLGATVIGTVVDAASGLPVTSGEVDFYDGSESWLAYGDLDGAGRYVAAGLLPGATYARTYNSSGYMDRRYDGYSCVGTCDPAKGTPLNPVMGQRMTGVDFSLYREGEDPDLVLEKERIEWGLTVDGCDRITTGPDFGIQTGDAVRFRSRRFTFGNGFFVDDGSLFTAETDAGLVCP